MMIKEQKLLNQHNKKLSDKGFKYKALVPYTLGVKNPRQKYLCENGHEFEADRARIMSGKSKCPSCVHYGKRWNSISYTTQLKNVASKLKPIEEFINITTRIDHICDKNHITKALPSYLLTGGGCAICSGLRKKTTEQYEKELFDKCLPFTICDEYHGSMVKVDHQCLECNNVWSVKPHDIVNGQGCPNCATMGFNRYKPAKVYFVELTNSAGRTLWKVGITTKKNILHRFRAENLKVKLIWEKEYDNGYEAEDNERLILNTYANAKAYAPGFLKHGGNTELFSYNVLKK